jgi:hypothetical protein
MAVAEDRTDFIRCLITGGVRANNANVDPLVMMPRRFKREDGIGRLKHYRDPPGAVVSPSRVYDRVPVNLQNRRDLGDLVLGGRPATKQGRGRKSQPIAVPADRHQSRAAFLHDHSVTLRLPACLDPGMGAA